MAITYGLLVAHCPSTTDEENVYTPGVNNTFKGFLTICNLLNSSNRMSIAHKFDTSAAALGEWKFYNKPLTAYETIQIPITLSGTQTISVRTPDNANSVAFTFDGQLKDNT